MSRTSAVGTWVLNEELYVSDNWFIMSGSFYEYNPRSGTVELCENVVRSFVKYEDSVGTALVLAGTDYVSAFYATTNPATSTITGFGGALPSVAILDADIIFLQSFLKDSDEGLKLRTFTISEDTDGGADPYDPDLIAWLEANATYVQSNIEVSMTSPDGVTLATEGKYVPANVKVTPTLQEKTVTESGDVTPDEGYVGLSKVTVDVESGLTSAEGVEF